MANQFMMASFDNVEEAAEAYNQLVSAHFDDDEVSVITTEDVREEFNSDADVDDDDNIGVGEGIAKGALAGGLFGLIVSAVPLAIAGLPSLIVVGPIAVALGLAGVAGTTTTTALAGGAIGGMVGLLDSIGVSEDEAAAVEETVRQGGVLLAVPVAGENEQVLRDLFEDAGADRVLLGEEVEAA